MRSKKQTGRRQLLMESSLAYPRGKEENSKKLKGRQKRKEKKTLGYLGVVNPVTSKEDVPLRGRLYGTKHSLTIPVNRVYCTIIFHYVVHSFLSHLLAV
ncbi:hypothetical protein AVEN_87088-1 [Araneus ventricosus]|uniref:Uncharacterized protein n=1 Tax=Araneus ventricosus TaxID=182803 RepID=A0A4Y2JZS7_ARAVE|nr:hypothetical protein AVEN_87088-1 [Araneus ventricosus]